jgi:hypothetical protein
MNVEKNTISRQSRGLVPSLSQKRYIKILVSKGKYGKKYFQNFMDRQTFFDLVRPLR